MNFLDRFSKNHYIWNSKKIRPTGADMIRVDRETDRRTDMTTLIIDFRN